MITQGAMHDWSLQWGKMKSAIGLLVCVAIMSSCADKHEMPALPATTYISASGEPLAAARVRADGTLDPKLLAEAKKAGYSLVNTNGQLLYCRTDIKLGTHIRKDSDTVCFTAQEMNAMQEQTRKTLEQFHPSHSCLAPNC